MKRSMLGKKSAFFQSRSGVIALFLSLGVLAGLGLPALSAGYFQAQVLSEPAAARDETAASSTVSSPDPVSVTPAGATPATATPATATPAATPETNSAPAVTAAPVVTATPAVSGSPAIFPTATTKSPTTTSTPTIPTTPAFGQPPRHMEGGGLGETQARESEERKFKDQKPAERRKQEDPLQGQFRDAEHRQEERDRRPENANSERDNRQTQDQSRQEQEQKRQAQENLQHFRRRLKELQQEQKNLERELKTVEREGAKADNGAAMIQELAMTVKTRQEAIGKAEIRLNELFKNDNPDWEKTDELRSELDELGYSGGEIWPKFDHARARAESVRTFRDAERRLRQLENNLRRFAKGANKDDQFAAQGQELLADKKRQLSEAKEKTAAIDDGRELRFYLEEFRQEFFDPSAEDALRELAEGASREKRAGNPFRHSLSDEESDFSGQESIDNPEDREMIQALVDKITKQVTEQLTAQFNRRLEERIAATLKVGEFIPSRRKEEFFGAQNQITNSLSGLEIASARAEANLQKVDGKIRSSFARVKEKLLSSDFIGVTATEVTAELDKIQATLNDSTVTPRALSKELTRFVERADEILLQNQEELYREQITPFKDVSTRDWYFESAVKARELNIASGQGEGGELDPQGTLNRAQIAKMVVEAAGVEKGEEGEQWFDAYLESPIVQATDFGRLTAAKNAGQAVSRGEVIKFLLDVYDIDCGVASGKVFKDAPARHRHAACAEKARDLGIIGGNPDGSIRLDDPINRAEALKIVTVGREKL